MTEELVLSSSKKHEDTLLGACIVDKLAAYESVQALNPSDFTDPHNRNLFMILESMVTGRVPIKKLSLVKKTQELRMENEIGGLQRIYDLSINGFGTDYKYYIEQLRLCTIRRSALYLCSEKIPKLAQAENPIELIDEISKELMDCRLSKTKDFTKVSEVMTESHLETIFEEVYKTRDGLDFFEGFRTDYPALDAIIGGFKNGTTNIIGARSSSGKTTFLINLFINMFKRYDNFVPGFFSLEMPNLSITEKIMGAIASIPYKRIGDRLLSDEEIERMKYVRSNFISKWPLHLYDIGTNISQAKAIIRRNIIKQGINIVFVDYLTRIKPDKNLSNKHLEVDQISKGLQDIAQEFNIPVVTLAQLNRNVFGRPDKRPVIGDLRESGSIEEDADLIMLMHRPASFDATKDDQTEIYVVKSRLRGDLGMVKFDYLAGRLEEAKSIESLMPKQYKED